MAYFKRGFVNSEFYHIILRALDNNLIFKDNNDYYRGIFSIYEFNNLKPVEIWLRRKQRIKEKKLGELLSKFLPQRDFLVEISAFCFMPNHIHLLVKQIKDGGVSKFMMKVGAGYGGYFNRKYKRKGHVFQNRFLSVPIKNENQLKIIFSYIHTNPVAILEPNWKELGIKKNYRKVVGFLENYKWSSYSDYLGIKNFPSVTNKDFMLDIMGGIGGCRDFIGNWIKDKQELARHNKLFLE